MNRWCHLAAAFMFVGSTHSFAQAADAPVRGRVIHQRLDDLIHGSETVVANCSYDEDVVSPSDSQPQPSGCTCYGSAGSAGDGTGMDYGMGAGADYGAGMGAGDGGAEGYGFLSEAAGAGRGAYGSEAGMIGDFFGGGYSFTTTGSYSGFPSQTISNIPIAGGDRRFKISDNNSPFPTDRVFFNYHHFENPVTRPDGGDANVDRYMFGFEKTFFDGLWSAELRAPVVSGLSADQLVDGVNTNFQSTQFGNLGLAVKRSLFRGDFLAISGGVGIIFPTASDVRVLSAANTPELIVQNQAYFLQPFIGAYFTPTNRLFSQFSVQADVDAHGNPVDVSSSGPGRDGVMQDQTLMYFDVSVGYWLFRNPYGRVSGLAPIVELHHTTTLQDTDVVSDGTFTLTNPNNRMDIMNITGGLRTEIGRSFLTTGVMVPLRGPTDKFFDAELVVQFNRFF